MATSIFWLFSCEYPEKGSSTDFLSNSGHRSLPVYVNGTVLEGIDNLDQGKQMKPDYYNWASHWQMTVNDDKIYSTLQFSYDLVITLDR